MSNWDNEQSAIVNNIFVSLQGEVNRFHQGSLALFIRFQQCNLRCSKCDTPQALMRKEPSNTNDFPKQMTVKEIVSIVKSLGIEDITITGGEPLLQKEAVLALCRQLRWPNGTHRIVLETNGSIPLNSYTIKHFDCVVADFKMPGSGEFNNMWRKNYKALRKYDFVKFPVYDMQDLDYAFEKIHELTIFEECKATYAISPIDDLIMNFEMGSEWTKDTLLQKIIERIKNSNRSDIILNVQLHKLLNFE